MYRSRRVGSGVCWGVFLKKVCQPSGSVWYTSSEGLSVSVCMSYVSMYMYGYLDISV